MRDLFPSFSSHWVDTSVGKLFVRKGGEGFPLLLLHGFPQCHVMWHKIAGELAKKFTLIIPDLPGYGWSAAPKGGKNHEPYRKSDMAALMIEVMEHFGFVHFNLCGHDRGARVAYRLELEHKGRVNKMVLIDILPTFAMWDLVKNNPKPSNKHWLELSAPYPLPENEIKKDPIGYLNGKLGLWGGQKGDEALKYFSSEALAAYRAFFQDPNRIHACCEDYRAGATADLEADLKDLNQNNKISCPVLCLWGETGIPASGTNPLLAWEKLCLDLQGKAIQGGHFLPEENPQAVLEAVEAFFWGEI